MTDAGFSTKHLSVVMTTDDVIQSTTEDDENTSSSPDIDFYFHCAVIAVGVVGMAANGLILYAFLVSKEHKKHALIFNQNALDFFSSLCLVVTYTVHLSYEYVAGDIGHWLCILTVSDNFVWWGITASKLNLICVTVERYLKVVHPAWSSKWLRNWMLYLAIALTWISGITYNAMAALIAGVEVHGIECWVMPNVALGIWNFMVFSVVPLAVFAFCYGRILAKVRRQARVMAGHNTGQTSQANQIQTNVIKVMIYVTVFFGVTNFPLDLLYRLTSFIPTTDSIYYHVFIIVAVVYISTNPFIYATKFDPVRSVLLGLIPCKKTAALPASAAIGLSPGPSHPITQPYHK